MRHALLLCALVWTRIAVAEPLHNELFAVAPDKAQRILTAKTSMASVGIGNYRVRVEAFVELDGRVVLTAREDGPPTAGLVLAELELKEVGNGTVVSCTYSSPDVDCGRWVWIALDPETWQQHLHLRAPYGDLLRAGPPPPTPRPARVRRDITWRPVFTLANDLSWGGPLAFGITARAGAVRLEPGHRSDTLEGFVSVDATGHDVITSTGVLTRNELVSFRGEDSAFGCLYAVETALASLSIGDSPVAAGAGVRLGVGVLFYKAFVEVSAQTLVGGRSLPPISGRLTAGAIL
jgi:hypothetical protein